MNGSSNYSECPLFRVHVDGLIFFLDFPLRYRILPVRDDQANLTESSGLWPILYTVSRIRHVVITIQI